MKDSIGYQVNFFQENETRSKKGVLRGLHFQLPPFAQSKLVRVIDGEVLDIVVDIRKSNHWNNSGGKIWEAGAYVEAFEQVLK